MKLYNKYNAFTLAEVLITLLIIGVVASIIIPNLLNDTRDAEYKTAWKKEYAEIAAATNKIMMDNGGTMKEILYGGVHTNARNKYLEYLSGSHKCTSYTTDCGTDFCNYFNSVDAFDSSYSTDNSLIGTCTGSGGGFAILNNGAFFTITSASNGGNAMTCSPYCAKITIDINGFKSPNKWGKDIFGMFVLENTIKPFGYPGFPHSGSCLTQGYSCSLDYLSN